jgi:hypothetical protein
VRLPQACRDARLGTAVSLTTKNCGPSTRRDCSLAAHTKWVQLGALPRLHWNASEQWQERLARALVKQPNAIDCGDLAVDASQDEVLKAMDCAFDASQSATTVPVVLALRRPSPALGIRPR